MVCGSRLWIADPDCKLRIRMLNCGSGLWIADPDYDLSVVRLLLSRMSAKKSINTT